MDFFCCYIFVTRDGRGGTLLSLVDPGSNNISIVPELPFQEVGRLLLSAQQRTGRLSCNGPGDSDGSPSCTSLPKGVTTSYHSTNITKPIPFRRWGVSRSQLGNATGVCLHLRFYLKILLFIQFLSYMFYIYFSDLFVLMVYIFYFK